MMLTRQSRTLVPVVLVWLCVGAVPGAEPADDPSPALRGQLEKLDAAIAEAPDDPMNHYRKAQCLTRMGEYDRGYQAARGAMQRFIEKKSTLAWLLLEEIDMGTVRVQVRFNMGPDERQPPGDHGIVRPVSFIVRKEGLRDVIDYEIGYIGGKPSTAALGMMQTDGSHANFGMIQLDAKYETIRKQALDLINTRYKPEPVERPAGRAEDGGDQEGRLFPFREPGEQPRWGYMNRKGDVVIQPEYLMAYDFFEGKAQVQTPGRIVYLDNQGQRVCSAPSVAYSATRFSDGLARFSVTVPYRSSDPDADPFDTWRVKWGYFDATGQVVIEPKFGDARDFSEGQARVNVGATPHPQGLGVLGGKWGFIDRSGNWAVKPGDIVAVEDFSEGLGLVRLRKEHTWAFVNKKGEIAFKLPRYWRGDERAGVDDPARGTASRLHIRSVASFSEGLARVRYADAVIEFVDRTGKRVISPCPHGVQDFSEGLAILSDGEKFGYADRKGEWVIPPQFDSARPFSEGLAAVRTGKTWKYIDKRGKVAFVPSLPDDVPGPVNVAGNFSGGLARVHVGREEEIISDVSFSWLGEGAWYYLSRRGEFVKRMGEDSEVPTEMHMRAMMDADRCPDRQGKDVKRIREDSQGGRRSPY